MAGRPTKLTPEVREKIALAVAGAASFKAAAAHAGVSDSMRGWPVAATSAAAWS